jgi:ketosteroid isomerase-like protein
VTRIVILVAAVPALMAAAPAPDWQQQTLASAAPFIDKANDEWTRAIVTGDADVLSAPYAENGIFIGPDGNERRGKPAVREMYSTRRANVKVLTASIHSDGRAAADPDDVYEWGSASMRVQRGDKVQDATGRYLTVWHRSGATWLITHNIAF